MANEGRLTGVEKAAVLLMSMGAELASDVFRHLSPEEIQLIGASIVKRENISGQTARQVAGEFLTGLTSGETPVEGLEFAKSAIVKALGAEKSQDIIEHISSGRGSGAGIEAIKWMDPAALAGVVKNEHPQIVALILAHLDPDKAAEVVMHIPEDRIKGEVMLRVAALKSIPSSAVKDLDALLKNQAISAGGSQGSAVEGVKVAAEIMNQIDSKVEAGIMDAIEKASPDLAVKIQEKMFVFTDLLSLDDKAMQMIIKEISTDMLSISLKGSDDSLKDKFFKNMSERAAEMLKEDIASKGPVRLSDVEKTQQEIIKVARRLEQEGKIVRAGRGGDVLI
ncbi:MAG: flagellar motor switch protein FliG [Deltaproteobacteria bacterium]|nr:flagellar motor switch protein FliG [Deltaproteobacteria bacterium]